MITTLVTEHKMITAINTKIHRKTPPAQITGIMETQTKATNPDGLIKTYPNKVDAIKKVRLPKNQKEIKSFLDITGYYRRFIRHYSKITHHLVKYYIEAIHKLKVLLQNDPILTLILQSNSNAKQ